MQLSLPTTIKDRVAINGSIIFSVVMCLAILLLGTWLLQFELAMPDLNEGGFFYEWQLANPTFLSRATAWLGFGVHQILIWLTIWWAIERSPRKYGDTLRPVNIIALTVNAVFIVLHYLQTAVFYDGIAQDLPSWTAQFTVIMMLFVILAMENRRRGMFFGRKMKFREEFYRWMRDYHGYAFSFAVIYTFWFHPMIPTIGHLVGFLQVMLVMFQGSMMFTRMHTNRKWNFLLEILVLPHAASVALNQGGGIVFMFLFGFLTIFIVTQMHGLGLKPWVKNVFYAGFLLSVAVTYGLLRAPYMVNEVIRIPAIEYLMVFLMYWGWLLIARLTGKINTFRATDSPSEPATATGD